MGTGCGQAKEPLLRKEGIDASFHALFERRQHAFRPHTRFRPRPTGADLSCLCSLRHCRRWRFRVCGRHALHLPGSLCSTPITGASLLVWTLCLLPGRLFGSSQSMNTGLHPIGQVSLRHAHIPCGHSVANHLMALRRRFCALPFSAAHARSHPCRTSPLTRQARRTHPAESRSSSYGLVHHLRLLPTPPRGGAVIVSFRPESVCLERTCTSLDVCAWRRTRSRPRAGAWIETRGRVCFRRKDRSRPRAGAWIETRDHYRDRTARTESRPRAGAWIETFALVPRRRGFESRPRAGAWIETD